MNISFIKKMKLFRQFKRILNDNRSELALKLNLRIDNAYRLYTVINVPDNLIGEAYSLKKSDIDRISENYIREYTNEVSRYLQSKDLSELCSFYKIDKVGKYSYLIVYGFKLFKSNIFYVNLYWRIIPVIILIILGLFIFL